ncbi:MAG: hypothetical protein MI919_01205 [Holophagales bacterium]|nr:hypothetical protein [Holophagales bacterium]
MAAWDRLGRVPPRELVEARLEVHHALQLVAIGVGRALLDPKDDDSHTALTWRDVPGQWIGGAIPGTGSLRAGLRPVDLGLTLGGKDDPAGEQLELEGVTRNEGLAWLREHLEPHGIAPDDVTLDFHYEMPSHPVADGKTFGGDLAEARQELSCWFGLASALLLEASRDADASPIRTWPHHFDIATLLKHGKGDSHTVGVGLAAGDDAYAEPYFYVSPYPPPRGSDLPELPSGHWHTDGFFSAVLTGSELLDPGAASPDERARAFLTTAIAESHRLLDG